MLALPPRSPSPNGSFYLPSIAEELGSDSDSDGKHEYDPFLSSDTVEHQRASSPFRRIPLPNARTLWICTTSIGTFVALWHHYPFPTTIHVFISLLIACASRLSCEWLCIISRLWNNNSNNPTKGTLTTRGESTRKRWLFWILNIALISCLLFGLRIPKQTVPRLEEHSKEGDKWFIGANLYDNEEVFPRWSGELLKLVEYLGHDRVFISIYESNSHDTTPHPLLSTFSQTLTSLSIPHRILSGSTTPEKASEAGTTPRWWPYGTSPERITFLEEARNKVLEPLQSAEEGVRLEDWEEYGKVIFLNDIWYKWEDAVRLLNTRVGGHGDGDGDGEVAGRGREGETDYDLACGTDFGHSGLYNTWVARDICGNPLRIAWPYVKDPITAKTIARREPFEVAACWNGVVVFASGPYLYRKWKGEEGEVVGVGKGRGHVRRKRGWKMVDDPTYPNHRLSPTLPSPLKFRPSGIDACDHSECFLFSYDLHRYYSSANDTGDGVPRRPRIYMNPNVKVAYEERWWRWNDVVLEVPVVKLWNRHWSRGYPLRLVDWIWEYFARRLDYCTWAGLQLPGRCGGLEGSVERHWNQ